MTEAAVGGVRTVLAAVGLALMSAAACTGGDYTDNGVTCNLEETPPTITFISPEAGATLSGTAPIVINASDDCYITEVRFTADDGKPIGTLTNWVAQPGPATYTYRLDWDTRALPNGPVTVTAYADDGRMVSDSDPTPNPGLATRQFTILNP